MNRFASAVVVSVIAIGVAHAQQGPGGWHGGGGAGLFRMADANGDGVVTRAEYQVAVDARFARLDANGDGVLTPDERPGAGHRGMRGDGSPPPAGPTPPPPPANMTHADFLAQAMRRFDAADSNHDGKIDAAEMGAMMAQFRGPNGMAPPSSNGAPR